MRNQPLIAVGAAILIVAFTIASEGSIIVRVGDLTLAPGSSGFLDVTIRSDTGTDVLDTFGSKLLISTMGGTRLEFSSPPLDPQLTTPGYIFFGNSLAAGFPSAGSVSTTSTLRDTYIGGDGSLSMLGVTVPTTDTLITRLQVTSATSLPPGTGDLFEVRLVADPFTFFSGPAPAFPNIAFTSLPGVVSIGSRPVVIPEPCSLGIWSLLGLGSVCFGRRRH